MPFDLVNAGLMKIFRNLEYLISIHYIFVGKKCYTIKESQAPFNEKLTKNSFSFKSILKPQDMTGYEKLIWKNH